MIEHCSRSSKTINWSADSFQINHVTSSCFDSCQLTILWVSYIKDEDLPRHPGDTPPFLLIVSPTRTRTICRRVRTYVRWVSHVTTKRKEVDHIPWVWGSVPRALRAGGSPAIIIIVAYYYHFISNEGGLNIFFLFCLQYLLFLPKRQLQLQHSHQVEEEQGIAQFAKDPWEGTTF